MVRYEIYTKDTRIKNVDYLFEKMNKFDAIINYLKPKIEGTWEIALMDPPIQYLRDLLKINNIPEYVDVCAYVSRETARTLNNENPKLVVKEKSNYERFIDLLSEYGLVIHPKAVKELYRRVGNDKSKLPEYIMKLKEDVGDKEVTQEIVKQSIPDENRLYASTVLTAFLTQDRSRWKKYNELVQVLGTKYAFYALRKYSYKLLVEKNKYLRNEDTTIYGLERIDAFKINQAFVVFQTMKPEELDMCMRLIENRELMRRLE